jgi:Mrp family chromosome partitioning ATPase
VFRVYRSELVCILASLYLDICNGHDHHAIPSRAPTDSQNLLPLGLAKMEMENSTTNLGLSVDILCRRVAALQERFPRSTRRRILITLAGVPGSGKSTVATALTTSLREQGAENVVVLPMVLKPSR